MGRFANMAAAVAVAVSLSLSLSLGAACDDDTVGGE